MTFGDGGIVETPDRLLLDLVEQTDGKLVFAAWDSFASTTVLCRLQRDGGADAAFGEIDGCVTSPVGGFTILLSSGSIYLAGTDFSGAGFHVARFTENGVVDNSFGVDGIVKIGSPTGSEPATLRRMRLGRDRLYFSFILGVEPPFYPALARLHLDGALDSSFGEDGYVLFATETVALDAIAVLPVPDGRVLASSRNGVFSFREDGSIDSSFGSGRGCVNTDRFFHLLYGDSTGIDAIGWALTRRQIDPTGEFVDWLPAMAGIGPASDVHVDSAGVIVAGGSGGYDEDYHATIARRLPDGSPDTSFSSTGARHYLVEDTYGTTFQVQCDGRYVLGGHRDYVDGFILRVWN